MPAAYLKLCNVTKLIMKSHRVYTAYRMMRNFTEVSEERFTSFLKVSEIGCLLTLYPARRNSTKDSHLSII